MRPIPDPLAASSVPCTRVLYHRRCSLSLLSSRTMPGIVCLLFAVLLQIHGAFGAITPVATARLEQFGGSGASGWVTLFVDDVKTTLMGVGIMQGLQASVTSAQCTASTDNCATTVNSGTSCDTVANLGSDYYAGPTNPWGNAKYTTTDASGATQFGWTIQENSGGNPVSPIGRVFVVANTAGAPVACGILESITCGYGRATLQPIPGANSVETGFVAIVPSIWGDYGRAVGVGTMAVGPSSASTCPTSQPNACQVQLFTTGSCQSVVPAFSLPSVSAVLGQSGLQHWGSAFCLVGLHGIQSTSR